MAWVVFFQTLRDDRFRVFGFCIGLFAWTLLITCMFPSIEGMDELTKLIESYPPFIRAFMGPLSDMTKLEGFLSMQVYAWIPLLFSLHCILSGVRAVAGEERAATIDLLLTHPVPRWRVIVEKYCAMIVGLLLMMAATYAGIALGVFLVEGSDGSMSLIAEATINILPISLLIGALAFFLSAQLHGRPSAGAVATTLVVASYIVDGLTELTPKLEVFRPILMFHYYGSPVLRDGLVARDMMILAGAAAAFLALAVMAFQRRDIRA